MTALGQVLGHRCDDACRPWRCQTVVWLAPGELGEVDRVLVARGVVVEARILRAVEAPPRPEGTPHRCRPTRLTWAPLRRPGRSPATGRGGVGPGGHDAGDGRHLPVGPPARPARQQPTLWDGT